MNYRKYILFLVCTICCAVGVLAQNDSIRRESALEYMLQKRPVRPGFGDVKFKDHMFVSGMMGISYLSANGSSHAGDFSYYGTSAQIVVGKWASPISGFRAGVSIGFNKNSIAQRRSYIGLTADYLANFSALASGYDYDRLFEVVGVAGLDYYMGLSKEKSMKEFGAHIGLQAKFHVSPLVDLFIEPRIGIYTDGIDGLTSWRKYNTQPALYAGLTYNMVPYDKRTSTSEFERDFLSNTFFTIGFGGITMVENLFEPSYMFKNMRYNVSAGMGKWFTPISGLRLLVSAGYMDAPKGNTKLVGGQLDYMLNLNAAFGGYDADRRFELMMIVGLNATYSTEQGRSAMRPGLGLGLQGNLRLNRYNSIFIEPRLTLYDKDFVYSRTTKGNVDALGSISIGMNFMRVPYSVFVKRGQRTFDRFSDNMFISVGAGAQTLLQTGLWGGYQNLVSPTVEGAIGKWFTSISGLRLGLNAGFLKNNYSSHGISFGENTRNYMIGANLNYMFNFTSALFGYDENRMFEMIGTAGLSGAVVSGTKHRFYVGGNLGLQALFNITDHIGVYIEPSVKLFNSDFTYGYSGIPNIDGVASLTMGMNYRFKGVERQENRRMYDAGRAKNFVSVYGGGGMIINTASMTSNFRNWLGMSGRVEYGRWIAPTAAIRVGMTYDNLYIQEYKKHNYVGLNLEYMFDLASIDYGYDEERVFSLSGLVGPSFGVSYNESFTNFVPGLTGGLQARFRLCRALDLNIEPRFTVFSKKYITDKPYTGLPIFVGTFNAGLSYKF